MPDPRRAAAQTLAASQRRLQHAARRLDALASGAQQRLAEVVEQLDALPSAAGYQPFPPVAKKPVDAGREPPQSESPARDQRRPPQPPMQPGAGATPTLDQSEGRPLPPPRPRPTTQQPVLHRTGPRQAPADSELRPPLAPSAQRHGQARTQTTERGQPEEHQHRRSGRGSATLNMPEVFSSPQSASRGALRPQSHQGEPQLEPLGADRLIEEQLDLLSRTRAKPQVGRARGQASRPQSARQPLHDGLDRSMQLSRPSLPPAPQQWPMQDDAPQPAGEPRQRVSPWLPAPRAPSRLLDTEPRTPGRGADPAPTIAGATAAAPQAGATADEGADQALIDAVAQALIDQAWMRGVDLK